MNDKKNNILTKLGILEKSKQDIRKSVEDIPESPESKEQETDYQKILAHELAEEHIKDIQSNRNERTKYARNAFWFMCIFVIVVIGLVVCVSLGICSLEPIPLTALITTMPASMALFGWVLKGLFSKDKNR